MTALKMALVAVVASFMLALGVAGPASAQVPNAQQPLFTGGFLPVNGGFGLLIFVPGGSMLRLAGAAQIEGCTLEAVWRSTPSGEFATYIFRAPEFVNVPFVEGLPNKELPANSPLMVRCAKPAVPRTQGSDTPNGCSQEWPLVIREKVLSRMAVIPSVCFLHYQTDVDAQRAGAWQLLSEDAKRIYREKGGVGWWNGRITIIGPLNVELLAHELASANQEWYAALAGKEFYSQWLRTPAAAEFMEIGEWQRGESEGLWTSKGLEGLTYKPNPWNAESEIIRILLNPAGRYTQAQIDALVPPAYQKWAYKWVIVR